MTYVIDLFAGAGGFSTGASLAGARVVWAANHWPDAVEWHAKNHPGRLVSSAGRIGGGIKENRFYKVVPL